MRVCLNIDSILRAARSRFTVADHNQKVAVFEIADGTHFDPFKYWSLIDAKVGSTFAEPDFQSVVIQFRSDYALVLKNSIAEKIESACAELPPSGWEYWLEATAEAISSFRLQFALDISQREYAFPILKRSQFQKIKCALPLMMQGRWVEAYEALGILACEEIIPANTRANLKLICGQISLYQFENFEEAKRYLTEANALAPKSEDQGRRIAGYGDYLKQMSALQQAKNRYAEAAKISPALPFGLVGLGQCAQDEGDFEEAEKQYRRAKAESPGDTLGYSSLLKFLGRFGQFNANEAECKSLEAEIEKLNPEESYDARCELASLYVENERYPEAREWYARAIDLDRERPSGYFALAAAYEKEREFEKAVAQYEKGIEKAPESFDGYWGLTSVHEKQGNWANALEWYEKASRRTTDAPQWRRNFENIARARAALMYWKLKQRGRAEAILKNDLADDPQNQPALDVLGLITDSYETNEALGLYNEVLQTVPTPQPNLYRKLAAIYRNVEKFTRAKHELRRAFAVDQDRVADDNERLLLFNAQGNALYAKRRYKAATECYRQAIAIRPEDPILHANLAGALAKLKVPKSIEEAIAEYRRALELDPSGKYETVIERLELTAQYGDHAVDGVERGVTPILVEVSDELSNKVADAKRKLTEELSKLVENMRAEFDEKYGVVLPGMLFRAIAKESGAGWFYRISLMGVPFPEIERIRSDDPQPLKHLMEAVARVLRENFAECVGHQEVARLTKAIDEALPTGPKALSALVSVCRALLVEDIGLRPFEAVLEEFKKRYSESGDLQDIVEHIRARPEILTKLPDRESKSSVFELSRAFEAEIRLAIHRSGNYKILALEPATYQSLLNAIQGQLSQKKSTAISVNTPDWRPFVRLLTKAALPHVPVLARRELADAEIAGKIEVDGNQSGTLEPFYNVESAARPSSMPTWDDGMDDCDPHITIFFNRTLAKSQSPDDADFVDSLRKALNDSRDSLYDELGIFVPEPATFDSRNDLESKELFRIRIGKNDYIVRRGERSAELTISGVDLLGRAIGESPKDWLKWAFERLIRVGAGQFQTVRITKFMLDAVAVAFPVLVEIARKRFNDRQICRILRLLLDERISIRDLRSVLESVLALNGVINIDLGRYVAFPAYADNLLLVNGDAGVDRPGPADYAEFVRSCRKRYISYDYVGRAGATTLPVYLLDQRLEADIRKSGDGASKELRKTFAEAVKKEIGRLELPILLTNADIRRTVWDMIREDIPNIAVLSYQELEPGIGVQRIATIKLPVREGLVDSGGC